MSRVLRPGGVFVASTFLNFSAPLGELVGNDALVAPLSQLEPSPRTYKWCAPGGAAGRRALHPAAAGCVPLRRCLLLPSRLPADPCPPTQPLPPPTRRWSEPELRELCESVGLVGFRRARSNRFILFSATKPMGAS